LLEREKDLNEMKSRFVSIASHEFRTPLATVLSSVSLVERYNGNEQEVDRKKHIERIKLSVRNLTEILTDFLSLDKVEQGKVEVSKEIFQIEEFCKEMLRDLKAVLKKGQVIKYKHLGDENVWGDKKILRMIILNLISNASKYSPEGQEIKFNVTIRKNTISIIVEDNGIGIPIGEQKNIFTTFYRAKNVSNIQGTGLGLNIVKRYVELLGGKISFTSIPDKDTIFTVELPMSNIEYLA